MKILITGATGFIGRAVVPFFLTQKRQVVTLIRKENHSLPSGAEQVVGELSLLCDIKKNGMHSGRDIETIVASLQDVETIVHMAGIAHRVEGQLVSIDEYIRVNSEAALALASLAAEQGVKRFIFLSSTVVNGKQSFTPFTESDEEAPDVDGYSISKFRAEKGLMQIAKETGMEVVIIRAPLVYGPGVKGNFESMIRWLKKGLPLPFGAINNVRSLVALDNLVDFIALCADRKRSPKATNEVFLISDREDVSTTLLLQKVAKAYGVGPVLFPVSEKWMKLFARILGKEAAMNSLFGNLQVDSAKAKKILNWTPVITMDEQLEKMVGAEIEGGY